MSSIIKKIRCRKVQLPKVQMSIVQLSKSSVVKMVIYQKVQSSNRSDVKKVQLPKVQLPKAQLSKVQKSKSSVVKGSKIKQISYLKFKNQKFSYSKYQKSRVQSSKVQFFKSQLFRYRRKNRLNPTTKENARGQVQKHIAYLSNCPIQGYVLERLPSSNSTTLGALAEFLSIIYAYWRVPVYERRQPKNIIPVRNYLALEAPSDCQKQSEKLC